MLKGKLKLKETQVLTRDELKKINAGTASVCPKTAAYWGIIGAASNPALFGAMCLKEITLG